MFSQIELLVKKNVSKDRKQGKTHPYHNNITDILWFNYPFHDNCSPTFIWDICEWKKM